MNRFIATWIAPTIRGDHGIYWCAAWFGAIAVVMFAFSAIEPGLLATPFLLAVGGVNAYAAAGLLRGLKPAWHIATFFAFVMIVTRTVATACAPGEIADGDSNLLDAAVDIVLLALAIIVFAYLRKPVVRRRYDVPESYLFEKNEQ